MTLINKVIVKNFKCFRNEIDIPLNQGTYLVGINNAGKTAILNAIHFFFDESIFTNELFLNKTNYLAKKAGYNKSEISLEFNLEAVSSKALKAKLIKIFPSGVAAIKKNITFSPDLLTINSTYNVKGINYVFNGLDESIKKMLLSVKIIYIHPQEGRDLMINAQNKLRARLLANWGRNAKLAHSIKELQNSWNILRKQAREYLSRSLTDGLQNMWPDSIASIDLPKDIKDIVAISDITFKGDASLPEIDLMAQGTGAQTTILYLTHYLLDSDRSLHQGEYHPVWLLEEPESFLHADLVAKFALQLNSESWLNNIQIVVSTHSPVLLASSRLGRDLVLWNLLDNYELQKTKNVEDWNEKEIELIGKVMGDQNFLVYFSVSRNDKIIYIEDKKDIIAEKLKSAGINVESGLGGIDEIIRHICVLLYSPKLSSGYIYFIADGDKGFNKIKNYIDAAPIAEVNGFRKFRIKDSENMFLIVLPENEAMENMFNEYPDHLMSVIGKIWNVNSWKMNDLIPKKLTRVCAECRNKTINSIETSRNAIKNHQDTKDLFWEKVKNENLNPSAESVSILASLLDS